MNPGGHETGSSMHDDYRIYSYSNTIVQARRRRAVGWGGGALRRGERSEPRAATSQEGPGKAGARPASRNTPARVARGSTHTTHPPPSLQLCPGPAAACPAWRGDAEPRLLRVPLCLCNPKVRSDAADPALLTRLPPSFASRAAATAAPGGRPRCARRRGRGPVTAQPASQVWRRRACDARTQEPAW